MDTDQAESKLPYGQQLLKQLDYIWTIRDITDVEFIGRGGFGEVCKGKITGDDGKFMDVAIKKIKFAGQKKEDARRRLSYLHRELSLLKILRSNAYSEDNGKWQAIYAPLTMRVYDAYIVHNIDQESFTLYQIIEVFSSDLNRSKQALFDLKCEELRFLMYQVILAIDYIHHLGIVHRDISPDNIFVNLDQRRLVISDFGQARFYVEYAGRVTTEKYVKNEQARMRSGLTHPGLLGKIHYRPPEGLSYYASSHYEQSWDMWQIGLVFLTMIVKNKHPFATTENDYQMLTRHFDNVCGLTNDAYMVNLIEQRFGYPTQQELHDLLLFHPLDDDDPSEGMRDVHSREQHLAAKEKYYQNVLRAFLTTHKKRQFQEVRNLGTRSEVDIYRIKYLTANRRMTFTSNPIVSDAVKFIVKLLRYAPRSRLTSRECLSDEFFHKPVDQAKFGPLIYSPLNVNELPRSQRMYQDKLSNSAECCYDNFQKFINDFVTTWGYITVCRVTPKLQKEPLFVLVKAVRKVSADSKFSTVLQGSSPQKEIQDTLNMLLQPHGLKTHVYKKTSSNVAGKLTIPFTQYIILMVDLYIIVATIRQSN